LGQMEVAALPPPSPAGRRHSPLKRGRTSTNRRPAAPYASRPSHRGPRTFAQPEAAAAAAHDSDPTAAAATTAALPVEKKEEDRTDGQSNRKKIRFIKHLEGRYVTKANAAAFEHMTDFFAALQEYPNLIRKLIIEMRRQTCAHANRGQFDRVREYMESRLDGGRDDGFQQIKDEVAKHAAMPDTEQEAMLVRACEDEFGEDWCANFVPAFLKSRARAAGMLKAREGFDCPVCLGVITKGRKGRIVRMRELGCHDKMCHSCWSKMKPDETTGVKHCPLCRKPSPTAHPFTVPGVIG